MGAIAVGGGSGGVAYLPSPACTHLPASALHLCLHHSTQLGIHMPPGLMPLPRAEQVRSNYKEDTKAAELAEWLAEEQAKENDPDYQELIKLRVRCGWMC